jgi:hypothetical protein
VLVLAVVAQLGEHTSTGLAILILLLLLLLLRLLLMMVCRWVAVVRRSLRCWRIHVAAVGVRHSRGVRTACRDSG